MWLRGRLRKKKGGIKRVDRPDVGPAGARPPARFHPSKAREGRNNAMDVKKPPSGNEGGCVRLRFELSNPAGDFAPTKKGYLIAGLVSNIFRDPGKVRVIQGRFTPCLLPMFKLPIQFRAAAYQQQQPAAVYFCFVRGITLHVLHFSQLLPPHFRRCLQTITSTASVADIFFPCDQEGTPAPPSRQTFP